MTEPTSPTKTEMLALLDNCGVCPECDECPLGGPDHDCDSIANHIRALIESTPEPGQKPKVTRGQRAELAHYLLDDYASVDDEVIIRVLDILGLEVEEE